MNNAIKSRSEALVEDIKEKSKYYVITDNHNKAIQMLEKTNVIIIAGEPGIGKTTLAKHMAMFYIEKDFECYDIENSINEAESIFEKDKKQIFYFDDFLGSNYLEALENKKDSHIVKFIDRIKRDKNKRFILTSRTNIFNQSILLSDTFKSKNIDEDEFIISIDSLKEMDKAYILYNHIWHSNLEETYIDEIYKDKRYKNIIKSKNFSPRIIEFITDTVKIKKENVKSSEYWGYLVDKLNYPQDIWKHAFDKGSDEFVRIIVMLTVFNGNKIEENTLRDAYNGYIKLSGLQSNSHLSKDFDSVIEEVVNFFLNRNLKLYIDGRKFISFMDNKDEAIEVIEYNLFNPSIADFILKKYKNNKTILINIISTLKSEKSLDIISNFHIKNYIDNVFYKEILSSAIYNKDTNISYLIKLINLFYNEFEEESLTNNEKLEFENKIHQIITFVIQKEENIESGDINLLIQTILYPSYKKSIEFSPELVNKIIGSVDVYDEYAIRELIDFISNIDISLHSKNFFNTFKILKDKIENSLFHDNNFPINLTNVAIENIENIISDDLDSQINSFIKKSFIDIGLDNDFNSHNKNISLLLNEMNIDNISKKMQESITDDVVDKLGFTLFENNKTYDTKNDDRINSNKKEADSNIEDLFER